MKQSSTFTRDQVTSFDWSECRACSETVIFAKNRHGAFYVLVPVPDGGGTGPTKYEYHRCPHKDAA